MGNFLKHLISKIGNWLLIWIWIIISIWIFGIIYAYTYTTQSNVWTGSWLTSTSWNAMLDNIRYLKDNVDTKLATNWNGSALTWLTKTQVWLWNVDNTSDLNKPISTAVQTALNLKANSSSSCTKIPLYNKTTQSVSIACVISANPPVVTTSCTEVASYRCPSIKATVCSIIWYICQ